MKREILIGLFLVSVGCATLESPYASSTKIYVQQDNLEKALENANKWIAEDSTNPKAYIWRALIYTKKGMYTEAAGDLKKAFSLDSTYMDADKFERAVSIAGQPLLRYESVSAIFNNAAIKLMDGGNTKDAITYLEYSLKVNPNNANTYLLLHTAYSELKDEDKAKHYLVKAVEIDPQNYRAKLQLAVFYKYEGKKEEAENLLKDAIELAERDTAADDEIKLTLYKEYAVLKFEKEELAEAEKYFKKAYEIKEDDYEVLANLGNLYVVQGKYDEAISYLKRAAEIKPDEPRIFQALAEVFYEKKDYKKALKYINKAIDLDPENPNLYRIRAAIHKAMGKKRKALRDLKKAMSLEKKKGKKK